MTLERMRSTSTFEVGDGSHRASSYEETESTSAATNGQSPSYETGGNDDFQNRKHKLLDDLTRAENFKAKGNNGVVSKIIAQELGFNRYERIEGHDFSSGDKYWENTGVFWGLVREQWDEVFRRKESFSISRAEDDSSMLFSMMSLANSVDSGELSDEKKIRDSSRLRGLVGVAFSVKVRGVIR